MARKAALAMVALVLVVVSVVDTNGELPYELSKPAAYTLTRAYRVSNNGTYPIVGLNISIFMTGNYSPYQLAKPVGLTPSYQSTETDSHGNVIARFQFRNIMTGGFAEVQAIDAVQVYSASYRIDPSNVPQYDVTQDLYKKYTSPQKLIESDSEEIKAKATEVIGSETNPYLKARKIYDFVKTYLSVEENGVEYGALWALQNKKGDCSEFSKLFVALCRASGLPSRLVHGYARPATTTTITTTITTTTRTRYLQNSALARASGHVWAEVYFQNYGWVPVDPMFGTTGKEYFGSMDNAHIAVARGDPIMTWTYTYVKDKPIANSTSGLETRPWGQEKSSISCSVSKQLAKLGEPVNVSGTISPSSAGTPVVITYRRPDGSVFTRMTMSSADGTFTDAYAPDNAGEWSVSASWYGNINYAGASSPVAVFTVSQ